MSDSSSFEPGYVTELQARLLAWFEYNRRDFPWRHTREPYAILLAEKLLQQTVAREVVTNAFRTLVSAYPSAKALANADASLATLLTPNTTTPRPKIRDEILRGILSFCARCRKNTWTKPWTPNTPTPVAHIITSHADGQNAVSERHTSPQERSNT